MEDALFALETAPADAGPLRRVAIDPVSRVEGHGKVSLLLDDRCSRFACTSSNSAVSRSSSRDDPTGKCR